MKRSLVLIPILLLVLLNACVTEVPPPQGIPNDLWTAVWQTQTATFLPPTYTPSPTLDPNEQWISGTLNAGGSQYGGFPNTFMEIDGGGPGGDLDLAEKLDQIEDAIGADFNIFDVRFPLSENGAALVFQVHARCECATNRPCCTPEHMFVLTMRNLYVAVQQQQYEFQNHGILTQVPGTIQRLEVVCYDHRNQFGVISATWADVQQFLHNQIDGSQFGFRVTTMP